MNKREQRQENFKKFLLLTQPPDDDCTQEVLNLNDIDRYYRFLDLIVFKNEMLLFR